MAPPMSSLHRDDYVLDSRYPGEELGTDLVWLIENYHAGLSV